VAKRRDPAAHSMPSESAGARGPESFLNTNLPLSNSIASYLHSMGEGSLEGKTVLDIGCGTGSLLRQAVALGAANACGVDSSKDAVDNCVASCAGHDNIHVAHIDCAQHTEVLDFVHNAASGEDDCAGLDLLLCNAAQIPLPGPLPNGYFVGSDGRAMIDAVLDFAVRRLPMLPGTELVMTHTRLSSWEKTLQACVKAGLQAEVIAGSEHEYELYGEVATDEIFQHLQDVCAHERGMPVQACLVRITSAAGCGAHTVETVAVDGATAALATVEAA
jgi:precorrin-6B methylase 2